jgi:hypothetical protein
MRGFLTLVATSAILSCAPTSRTESRASISGQVVLSTVPGLNDLSRVRVDVGRGEGGVVPDPQGRFEATDLEPDVYELTITYVGGLTSNASRSAYKRYTQRVVARSGGDVNLGLIPLAVARGTITGRVELEGGPDPAGASVRVLTQDGQVLESSPHAGTFTIPDVPVGTHTVTVTQPGYAAQGACNTQVPVTQEDDEANAGTVSLVVPEVAWSHGGAVRVVSGVWYAPRGATSVTLHVDSRWARLARVWTNAGDGGQPAYRAIEQEYVRPLGPGTTTISMQFADGCGYESPLYSQVVVLDERAPEVGLVLLADGAALTNQDNVALSLTVMDDDTRGLETHVSWATASCPNTAPGQNDPGWADYVPSQTVPLPPGDGAKTVCVWARDASGNVSAAPAQRTIVLDKTAPTISVELLPPGSVTSLRQVTARVVTTSQDVFSAQRWVQPGAPVQAWEPFLPQPDFLLPDADGSYELHVKVRDAAGNESNDAHADVTLDTTAPGAPLVVLGDGGQRAWTRVLEVPVVITTTERGVAGCRVWVRGDITGGSTPYPCDASSLPQSVTLSGGDGPKRISFSVADAAGNQGPATDAFITLDRSTPVIVSVSLSKAGITPAQPQAPFASSRSLALAVVASGADEMKVSGALSSVAGVPGQVGAWIPAAASVAVALTDEEGDKSVEVQVRDFAGNTSAPMTVTTRLDTTAPGAPGVVLGEGDLPAWSRVREVPVAITTEEEGLAGCLLWIRGDTAVNEVSYPCHTSALPQSVTLAAGDGSKRLVFSVADAAGNEGPATISLVTLDQAAPVIIGLSLSKAGTAPARPQSPFASTRTLALALVASNADEIKVSGTLESVGTLPGQVNAWIPAVASVAVVLTDADGEKTITVQVRDFAGNASAPATVTTTLDTTAPTGTVSVLGPRGVADQGSTSTDHTASRQVTLLVTASDGAGAAGVVLRAADDSPVGSTTLAYSPLATSVGYTLPAGDGPKTLYVQFADSLGNESAAFPAAVYLDTTPPSAPVLSVTADGSPLASGASTKETTVTLDAASTDVGGLDRYEWTALGVNPPVAAWTAVMLPVTVTMTLDTAHLFQVRAVDNTGNASPSTAFAVTQDATLPGVPTILTPRNVLNATTTSVTLSGADVTDRSFAYYEACTTTTAPGADCGTGGTCSPWARQSAGFAVTLSANQQTCLHARSVDAAENRGAVATVALLSDLVAPLAPTLMPQYDPSTLTVRASYVDLFVVGAATDAPLGGALSPYKGVAWLEVDSGTGFKPLCPGHLDASGTTWSPCNPTNLCTDPRLICKGNGTAGLSAVRVPLTAGMSNNVAIRAVDLAGNAGDGAQVVVPTEGALTVGTGAGGAHSPAMFGTTISHVSVSMARVTELGPNRRLDNDDPTCTVASDVAAVGAVGLVYVGVSQDQIYLRPRGPDGVLCTSDDPAPILLYASPSRVYYLAVSGDKVAFHRITTVNSLFVIENITGTPTVVPVAEGNGPLSLAGDHLLFAGTHVASAPTGSFAGGSTVWSASGVVRMALAPDGRSLLAAALTANGLSLVIRVPNSSGVYDGTPETAVASRSWSTTTGTYFLLGYDGYHAVSVDRSGDDPTTGIGYIVDWTAGPNGTFESGSASDDTFRQVVPGPLRGLIFDLNWQMPVHNGVLTYTDGAVHLVDLTSMRWDAANAADATRPAFNGSGSMFYVTGGVIRARTPRGVDSVSGIGVTDSDNFVAMGDNLVDIATVAGSPVLHGYTPGTDGLWFTADDPAPALLGTGYTWAGAGDGKLIALSSSSQAVVFEPGQGSLGSATPVVISQPVDSRRNLSISSTIAVYAGTNGGYLYLRDAGLNGIFESAGDDPPTMALVPIGFENPLAGMFAVSGRRVAIWNHPQLHIVGPGPDDRYGSPDDTDQMTILSGWWFTDLAFSRNQVALLGGPAGMPPAVYIRDLATGVMRQLSQHDSLKSGLAFDASGRAAWSDAAFPYLSIFLAVP